MKFQTTIYQIPIMCQAPHSARAFINIMSNPHDKLKRYYCLHLSYGQTTAQWCWEKQSYTISECLSKDTDIVFLGHCFRVLLWFIQGVMNEHWCFCAFWNVKDTQLVVFAQEIMCNDHEMFWEIFERKNM